MQRTKTWTHQLILAAARREVPARLFGGEPETRIRDALVIAGEHGMAGWLARELTALPEVAMPVKLQIQAVRAKTAGNHRRRMEATAEALGPLHDAGVPAMVVKGPALVERYYRDPAVRWYGDVDVLVAPERLRESIAILEARGFRLLDANWPLIITDFKGEVHLHQDRMQTIDLHWHLVNDARKRRTLRVSSADIWAGAQRTTLADVECYVMDPADELAYVCLHAALSGCHRFLWLLDMKLMAEHPDLDWDRVARRLKRWRFATAGYLALALANEWAGARVPLDALRSIRPGPVTRRQFRALVDRWDLGSKRGARLRQLFFASGGNDVAARFRLAYDAVVPSPGVYEAENASGRRSDLGRVTVGMYRRVRHKLGEPDAQSIKEFEPVGDPVDGRERYLRAVEGQASSR